MNTIKICKDLKPSKECPSCWMNTANQVILTDLRSLTCYIIKSKEELSHCNHSTIKKYILSCINTKYNDKIEYCYLAIKEYYPEFLSSYDVIILLQ